MCAFLRILHGVFDSSRRCVFCYGVCSRGAAQLAGSEAAENPSPAEESGADSTEGAQNTINQESATQTGNAGQTDAAQTEGAVQTDAAQTDGAAQADAVQNTESGADQNTVLIQTAGAESLAAFSYTAAPEAGLPAAATAGSGTLDVSGASYSGFSKGIAAKGWSEGAGFTVAVNAAGYTDLKFSADMRSSGTGPANFALEYSIDGASWTKISGTDVTLSTSLASVYQQTSLPAALSGKAFTLRVTMQGNTSVNQSTVGTNGVTSINNIRSHRNTRRGGRERRNGLFQSQSFREPGRGGSRYEGGTLLRDGGSNDHISYRSGQCRQDIHRSACDRGRCDDLRDSRTRRL